jgi:hypothetical protein
MFIIYPGLYPARYGGGKTIKKINELELIEAKASSTLM